MEIARRLYAVLRDPFHCVFTAILRRVRGVNTACCIFFCVFRTILRSCYGSLRSQDISIASTVICMTLVNKTRYLNIYSAMPDSRWEKHSTDARLHTCRSSRFRMMLIFWLMRSLWWTYLFFFFLVCLAFFLFLRLQFINNATQWKRIVRVIKLL